MNEDLHVVAKNHFKLVRVDQFTYDSIAEGGVIEFVPEAKMSTSGVRLEREVLVRGH